MGLPSGIRDYVVNLPSFVVILISLLFTFPRRGPSKKTSATLFHHHCRLAVCLAAAEASLSSSCFRSHLARYRCPCSTSCGFAALVSPRLRVQPRLRHAPRRPPQLAVAGHGATSGGGARASCAQARPPGATRPPRAARPPGAARSPGSAGACALEARRSQARRCRGCCRIRACLFFCRRSG